jgi:hypothetical protein
MDTPNRDTEFDFEYYQTGNYVGYLQRYEKYKNTANEIKELIKKPVIDFGCAVGFLVSAFQELDIEIQGYDISSWPIQYGREMLGINNITDQWHECNEVYKTLIALDVFEHMLLKDIRCVLEAVEPEIILARIPIADKVGEEFFLEVARRDNTHITCLTKSQWEEFFSKYGYKLCQVLNLKTIWDSKGVLSRIYVKNK